MIWIPNLQTERQQYENDVHEKQPQLKSKDFARFEFSIWWFETCEDARIRDFARIK